MTKSMTHHWFPIKAISFLFLLSTLPLYGEDAVQLPATETPPVQESQPGTQPRTTSSAPGQTAPVQQAQTSQTTLSSSPANDAARHLAGLPVAPGSKIAALTQNPSWQAHQSAMNQAFSQLEQRQLNNIRVLRAENTA